MPSRPTVVAGEGAFGNRDGGRVIASEHAANPVETETLMDLDAARRDSHVDEILEQLDRELVGLAPVKTRIRQLAHLLLIDRLRATVGLDTDPPPLHMSFTGPPGTGKTTVARRMAEILHRLGFVRKGHLVTATRDDLVGQYVGHTAPKTKEVLKRAMGGVLFIDEAYYLHKPENERDYGSEAIEILLQTMENQRDDIVVIFAGYKDLIDRFFAGNPGLSSRVTNHIEFPDYTTEELVEIAHLMLTKLKYEFTPAGEVAFSEYVSLRMRQPNFANARSIRNALDRARLRQATRLFERGGTVTPRDLTLIDEPEIRASRVFGLT